MILPILFIVATLVSYLYLVPRVRYRPSAVSVAEVVKIFDAAQAERELKRPLADIKAEAERKAIAMHSPLDGDPHQAQVVANRPDPTWNGHAPEPPSPIAVWGRERGGGGGTSPTRVVPDCIRNPLLSLREERLNVLARLYGQCREFSRSEQHELDQLDLRIAYYQRMADHL